MTWFGVEPATLAAILSIFFIGGFVKGVLGFGLPMMTMAMLPFLIPIEAAIVISALVQPATNVGQLITSGGIAKAFRVSWPVILTLLPGVALGAWFLSSLDQGHIMLIVGVMVVAFSIYTLSGFNISISRQLRKPVGMLTGFVAGIVGGLTSINGSLFIMYLVGLNTNRQEFRSAIAMLFVVSGALISSGFWTIGLLDRSTGLIGLLSLLPCFLGMWAGNTVGTRIPNDAFRRVILVALLIVGAVFIVRGV